MRGKRFATLKLLLLPACLVGAGLATAEGAPPVPAPSSRLPAVIVVFDASRSMGDKLGDKAKLDTARIELSKAVTQYSDQVSLGLITFGHRQKSNCADVEVLAKPGALNAGTYEKLLGDIKAKGVKWCGINHDLPQGITQVCQRYRRYNGLHKFREELNRPEYPGKEEHRELD